MYKPESKWIEKAIQEARITIETLPEETLYLETEEPITRTMIEEINKEGYNLLNIGTRKDKWGVLYAYFIKKESQS